jgi:peptide/nickel transport system ATP-binding protein
MSEAPILEARELTKVYRMPRKGAGPFRQQLLTAVDDVSLTLYSGATAALVGQSGSGKSTLVRLLSRLEQPTSGKILVNGEEAGVRFGRGYRRYTEQVQIVLQDPYASLNPGFRVGRSVRRPLEIHNVHRTRADRDAAVGRLLEQVKLTPPDQFASKFPHELSGGQRQRVAIARSLAVGPKVLLADEPVSMLDVSVKVEVLRVLNECQEKLGLALLYVTHDIASARWCADTISVMYAGQIVESGPCEEVTQHARHPYTQLLIRATPDPSTHRALDGQRAADGQRATDRWQAADGRQAADARRAPSGQRPPAPAERTGPDRNGCRFRGNCPSAMARCATAEPPAIKLADDQWVRCWLYSDAGTESVR